MQARRNLQLFDEGFDDFKRTVSEKSGVKFETKRALENKKNTETGEVCECSGKIGKDGCIDSQDYT